MMKESLISLAFQQFVTITGFDTASAHIVGKAEMKVLFARLPWDEKAFKVDDARIASDTGDVSSGNWMARVSKDGPCLILTPTMDALGKRTIIGGSQFWKRLATASHHPPAPPVATRPDVSPTQPLALDRWNKNHFAKWTDAPRPERDSKTDRASDEPSAARQA